MIYFLISVSIIVFDQISKFYAENLLMGKESFRLLDGIFHLTYARNTGAAFSFLRDQQAILQTITAVVIVFLIVFLFKESKKNLPILYKISLAFILGGAIGNLIDRVRLGYVVDYFDFTLINFAIFNVADSFVVVGTFVLGYFILFDKVK